MTSEVVNYLSLVGVCETQIEDALVEETYVEEIQVHEALSVDAEETHGEETQRVIWISCIDDWRCTCLTIGVREAREFDPMIWLRLRLHFLIQWHGLSVRLHR